MDRSHQDVNGVNQNINQTLDLLRPNSLVSSEQYRNNQARLEDARALIDSLEAQNAAAHKRFMEQELTRKMREGEEARRMLAALQGGGDPSTFPPSTADQFYEPAPLTSAFQPMQGQDVSVLPSTARIVEVSPSQRTSPPLTRSTTTSSSAPLRSNPSQVSQPTYSSYAVSSAQPYGYQTFHSSQSRLSQQQSNLQTPYGVDSFVSQGTPPLPASNRQSSQTQPTQAKYYRDSGTLPANIASAPSHAESGDRTMHVQPNQTAQNFQNRTPASHVPNTTSFPSSLDGALVNSERSTDGIKAYGRKPSPPRISSLYTNGNITVPAHGSSKDNLPALSPHVFKEMLLQHARNPGSMTEAMLKAAQQFTRENGPEFVKDFIQQIQKEGSSNPRKTPPNTESTSSVKSTGAPVSQPSTQPTMQLVPNDQGPSRAHKSPPTTGVLSSEDTAGSNGTQLSAQQTPLAVTQNIPSVQSRNAPTTTGQSESQRDDADNTFTNVPISLTARTSTTALPSKVPLQTQTQDQRQQQYKPYHVQLQTEIGTQAQTQRQAQPRAQNEDQARATAQTNIQNRPSNNQPVAQSTSGTNASRTIRPGSSGQTQPTPAGYWSQQYVVGSKPYKYQTKNGPAQAYWVPGPAPIASVPLVQPYGSHIIMYQPKTQAPMAHPIAQTFNVRPGAAEAQNSASIAPQASASTAQPSTPATKDTSDKPRTPKEADKKRLARDILRSLGFVGRSNDFSMPSKQPEAEAGRSQATANTMSIVTEQGPAEETSENSVVTPADAAPQLSPAPQTSHEPKEPSSLTATNVEVQPPSQQLAGLSISESQNAQTPVGDIEMFDTPHHEPESSDVIELTTPAVAEYRATASSPVSSPGTHRHQEPEQYYATERIPLFLPSPTSSPPPDPSYVEPQQEKEVIIIEDSESRTTTMKTLVADVEAMNVGDVPATQRKGTKRKMEYVLVPPGPQWVRQVVKKRKEHHDTSKAQGIVGMMNADEYRFTSEEQPIVDQYSQKVTERPCRWKDCDAVLNCGEKLSNHLVHHAQDIHQKGPVACGWEHCPVVTRSLSEMKEHVEKHAKSTIPCSRLGCDQQFRTLFLVAKHELEHHQETFLKPSFQPFLPRLPESLGPFPETLPSYRMVPRHVRPAPISAQRHATLGPWVLRNIFGPVELGMRRQNAGIPVRYNSRPDNAAEETARPLQDEYDFLKPQSPAVPRSLVLDDLPSAAISQMVQHGLVFWGPAETSKNRGVATSDDAIGTELIQSYEPRIEGLDGQDGPPMTLRSVDAPDWSKLHNSGEEESVTNMLL